MKQNWMSDYRRELGWDRLEIIKKYNLQKKDIIKEDTRLAKEVLGLEKDWYKKVRNYSKAYRFLKDVLEAKGIMVMQNGIVGNNTRRRLDINEFRAFALYNDIAPIIFINNNDSLGGKIFSLIHEYVHILLEQEDVFIQKEGEGYINQIVGEFLMPSQHIQDNWDVSKDSFEQIHFLASLFKVSETALAIKLKEQKLISSSILAIVIDRGIENYRTKAIRTGESGGDFYRTFNTRISPTFTQAIIISTEAGDTSYSRAFRLLGGIRGNTYDNIREKILPYG